MSYDFQRKTEHAFITIEKDMKGEMLPKVVLLCGQEEYLIKWYSDAIIKKYVCSECMQLDLVRLEGDDVTVGKIIESLETVSLMSERKVVLLPEFPPAGGRTLKGFSQPDTEKFTEYLGRIPEGSMLLITSHDDEDGRKGKNRLRSAVEKYGRVYDFKPLSEGQLKGFIEKRFKGAGKRYSRHVVDRIVSDSGYGNKTVDYSLYNLDNDLKKMIAHSGRAEEISMDDVDGILAVNPENNVFAMLDAIGRNRKDEAFRLLHNLLVSGMPVFNLLRMITNQLELMLSVKEMKEEGMSMTDMQKHLGIHQFRVKKALGASGHFSMEDLRRSLSAAYDVDMNIKTGLFEGNLALEYFIAGL